MLTEHERRLLGEIELHLGLTDPRLAARLAGSRHDRMVYRFRAWRRPLSALGMSGGVALVLAFFATAPLIALVGVAMMIAVSLVNASHVALACQTRWRAAASWWRSFGAQSDQA
jgi:Protein of unknown function (DUF3040)